MSDQLRVGLVGAGLIAGVHARAYRASPGVRLVAVTDPSPGKAERLAREHGARAVGDLDGLLSSGVDVVDVCTPPHHHAVPVIAALAVGHHVFCEKPLARTLEDGRQMVAAAQGATGLLAVGHVTRFEPDHKAAYDLVASGAIGTVRQLTHSVTSALPDWSEGGWLADQAVSGGPLLDQGVHSFDYARWMMASPAVRVQCMAADSGAGAATYTLTTVRYANDAIAHVECSWAHPAARGFKLAVEVVGTQGRLTWSNSEQMGGVLYPREGPAEWWDVLSDRGFTSELAAFFDAIRSGRPSPVPAEEAFDSLRTALAAVESVRTGQTVDLTTWEAS